MELFTLKFTEVKCKSAPGSHQPPGKCPMATGAAPDRTAQAESVPVTADGAWAKRQCGSRLPGAGATCGQLGTGARMAMR